MRLEINSGGLDSFFNGVSSFINTTTNASNSNKLIDSLQKVVNETNNISGGVGTLGTAVGFIQTRKAIEETRKAAMQRVKNQTNSFMQTAIRVDNAVAADVSKTQAEFYKTNPWLKPPSDLEVFIKGVGSSINTFCGVVGFFAEQLGNLVADKLKQVWDSATNIAKKCWNGIVDFTKKYWKEILITVGAVALVALSVVTFGGAAVIGAAIIGAVAGIAGTYLSDVATNIFSGETGWNVFKPVSSFETYVVAGAMGAIKNVICPGGGIAANFGFSFAMQGLTQGLEIVTGKRETFDGIDFMYKSIVGGAINSIGELPVETVFNHLNTTYLLGTKFYIPIHIPNIFKEGSVLATINSELIGNILDGFSGAIYSRLAI